MSETATPYATLASVGDWRQLDTRRWERAGEHFRWSLTWALFDQWRLIAYRSERAWHAKAFEAMYAPDGSMRPEHTYDPAQGMRWATALMTHMQPILEAEAR